MRLVSFGDGSRKYNFTDQQSRLMTKSPHVTKNLMTPGSAGGFDVYGNGISPPKPMTITFALWLHHTAENTITDQKDAIRALGDYGKKTLVIQPMDEDLEPRYCKARLKDIKMPEDVKRVPHRLQQVTLTFEASDPYWYVDAAVAKWGAVQWGSFKWNSYEVINASGTNSNTVITAKGSVHQLPTIRLTMDTDVTNPKIRRFVDGVKVDEVAFTRSFAAGDLVYINPERTSVTLNGADAYDTDFSFVHPDWFRLFPGDNDVRVILGGASEEMTVKIKTLERYR